MGFGSRRPAQAQGRVLMLAALGYAGGAMSITLLFLGMRIVMDVGGYCAEGGAYVIQTHCPDAAAPSMFIGMFGIFLFGFIATVYGVRLGGIWAAAPVLGWAALFGTLGWNFMEYGVFAPPSGSIEIGWLICGVLFWIMAFVPLLALVPILRSGSTVVTPPGGGTVTVRGPGKPARVIATPGSNAAPDEGPVRMDPDGAAQQEALVGIAGAFEAAVEQAERETPADPAARTRPVDAVSDEPAADFSEGTQALLDRLERLADMRDHGLLEPAEYETAKEAIMRELETRS